MTKLAFVLDNGRELQIPLVADMPLGRLAEVTAAVQDAELLHQERLKSLALVSARHERVCAEVAEATNRHQEVCSEVHRLRTIESETRLELQTLAVRKEQSLTALQDLSGRRAVEEEFLKSLQERTSEAGLKLRETNSAVATAQACLDAVKEKISQALHAREQIDAELDVRTRELAFREAKLAEVQTEHGRVVEARETLAAACTDLAAHNEQLQQAGAEIEAILASLTVEEQVARQTADAADAARREAAEALRQTEESLNACRTELQSLERRTADARESLASTEAFQTSLTQVLASQQRCQAGLQESIRSLEELLASRQSVLASTERELSGAEQQLRSAREALSSTQRLLSECDGRMKTAMAELECKEAEVASRRDELASLDASLVGRRQELVEAVAQLSQLALQLDRHRQEISDGGHQLASVRDEHSRLSAEIRVNRTTLEGQQKDLAETQREQESADARLVMLRDQESAIKSSIEALAAGEKTQRQRYDELRSLADAAELENANRSRMHEEKLKSTCETLQQVEDRLEALEAWNQRMIECQARLVSLDPDSLEARNLRNDIEVSMAGLRHLLSKRARAVAPPPLPPRVEVRLQDVAPSGGESASVALEDQAHVQRSRPQTGGYGRLLPQAGFTPREADRQLEDKIRQNEARLELLERRLKRGELEEKRQREKITTLRQQLGEVAGEISTKALFRA